MPSLSRALLLPLLIVVQFFAPLLHAHTGLQNPHYGIHLPGLEAYGNSADGLAAEQVQASAHRQGEVCLIVAIDDGIQEQHAALSGAAQDSVALPMWLHRIFQPDATAPPYVAFPDPQPPLSRLHPLPPSPRAPPAP